MNKQLDYTAFKRMLRQYGDWWEDVAPAEEVANALVQVFGNQTQWTPAGPINVAVVEADFYYRNRRNIRPELQDQDWATVYRRVCELCGYPPPVTA